MTKSRVACEGVYWGLVPRECERENRASFIPGVPVGASLLKSNDEALTHPALSTMVRGAGLQQADQDR